jgi:hypothetical protein
MGSCVAGSCAATPCAFAGTVGRSIGIADAIDLNRAGKYAAAQAAADEVIEALAIDCGSAAASTTGDAS